ncbi:hypothetical protein C8Q78DRAFT_994627 [Trametes maxima]|nr:hypothetical protein C8Q78DRAFT_994627 [Trametes maxima]
MSRRDNAVPEIEAIGDERRIAGHLAPTRKTSGTHNTHHWHRDRLRRQATGGAARHRISESMRFPDLSYWRPVVDTNIDIDIDTESNTDSNTFRYTVKACVGHPETEYEYQHQPLSARQFKRLGACMGDELEAEHEMIGNLRDAYRYPYPRIHIHIHIHIHVRKAPHPDPPQPLTSSSSSAPSTTQRDHDHDHDTRGHTPARTRTAVYTQHLHRTVTAADGWICQLYYTYAQSHDQNAEGGQSSSSPTPRLGYNFTSPDPYRLGNNKSKKLARLAR